MSPRKSFVIVTFTSVVEGTLIWQNAQASVSKKQDTPQTWVFRFLKWPMLVFLLPQVNRWACVDFGHTHPIDGLFCSLPIYLLGFFSK
jgi:hypothetical protein